MQMRRKDRQVTDTHEIIEMLNACKILRIALQDAHGLYIVPVNHAFEYENDRLVFYFHGAFAGRKAEAFAQPIPVAFELDGGGELVENEIACQYGYRFFSVMGTGTGSTVTDPEAKKRILTLLMEQQAGKHFDFTDEMAATVAVFRIDAAECTAKRRA